MENTFFKRMLKELYIGYKTKDIKRIKSVEKKCVGELVLGFNKNLFNLALLCFMISKLLSKDRYSKSPYIIKVDEYFNLLKTHIKERDYISMRKIITKMIKLINTLDEADKKYINKLAYNGKVKIGAKLYAQGLSLSTASKLTGADKFDILSYIGKTLMADRVKTYKPISKRLKEVEAIFLG
ncbi:hypothetical protein J7J90_04135 [Candidatus Micrarchaeota archaeon]|nr:hypothetical protein [Candidatus Micrarchaeota archaeon]